MPPFPDSKGAKRLSEAEGTIIKPGTGGAVLMATPQCDD